MKDLAVLEDLGMWVSLDIKSQDAIITELSAILGSEYEHQYTLSYVPEASFRVPTFLHLPTGTELNLIVGGAFKMGLSITEEKYIRAIDKDVLLSAEVMRPEHSVKVRPFLMSRLPILEPFARSHMSLNPDVFRPEFGTKDDSVPIYLTREEVNVLTERFDLSLPSESQWEYAYRGGTKALFYFGNSLPGEYVLETEILLYNFNDPQANRKAANPFGLVGMCVGEWCEDSYRENYDKATGTDLPVYGKPPYVVRGGAAALWPWQGNNEWLLCVSAMRMSSDILEDNTCGARFVKRLHVRD
jgi:formylglycine-generating enzyme required for sulfatase activity